MNEVIRLCMLNFFFFFFFFPYRRILFHRRGGFVKCCEIASFEYHPSLYLLIKANSQRNMSQFAKERSERTASVYLFSTEEL